MPRFYILLVMLAPLFFGCIIYLYPEEIPEEMCGNEYYEEGLQFCQDQQIYEKCSGYKYDPLNQKCENDSLFSKCGDAWYNAFSEFCDSDGNIIVGDKGEFADIRDGKAYKYAIIGTQTWMAENLRYETSNTKCYDDDPSNCEIYGILYDWNTAKKACPFGWHLPSEAEWFMLRKVADNDDTKLMANDVLWTSGEGTDEFGFTALPGGYYRHEGYFLNIGESAVFWSTTAGSSSGSAHGAIFSPMSWVKEIVGLYTNNSWVNVRCIKDI